MNGSDGTRGAENGADQCARAEREPPGHEICGEAARGPRAEGTRKPRLCFFTGRSLMPGGFESPEKLFGFDLTGEAVYSPSYRRF